VNLQANDFELFGLPQQFAQELDTIAQRWKTLQAQAHPDKFAAEGVAAQRLSMQWSVRINEAYARLKHPVRRAAYLCELAGAPIQAHHNTAMPAAFLMQQMQWHEALEEAQSLPALEALQRDVQGQQQQLLQECEKLLDQQRDYAAAVAVVRALMFVEKLALTLNQRIDQWD
jgi:molecular chaperone HscB